VLGPGVPETDVLASFPEPLRRLVSVVPRATEQDVIRAFRTFDVLVWPSTYEGFGLVLLEAMTQGMAIVATPVGCAPALVRDGENGLMVPRRDGRAVAAAVRRLLGDRDLRERLGSAARAAVSGMTWRHTAERTLETYRRAIGGVA
jgi:glycosyltransferase involved in cell wall biosynthesis